MPIMDDPNSYSVYPHSVSNHDGCVYQLVRGRDGQKCLAVKGKPDGFEAETPVAWEGFDLFPLTPANAAQLRSRLPWLRPVPLGLRASVGTGDRLGLATPGHVRAFRGRKLSPVFAQQSARENARTRRSPQQVLDAAVWGIFQEGWKNPWGADADHLKTPAQANEFIQAGYTFFTIDPGDHVRTLKDISPESLLEQIYRMELHELGTDLKSLRESYLGRSFNLGPFSLEYDEQTLYACLAKYGAAIAHIVRLNLHVGSALGSKEYDLEISIDETEEPTSPHEHYFLANELRRLGVRWVSLAPRFTGRFEKGVDFIGDLTRFEADLRKHAAIQQWFGGYKISLHSGSDKFSIYPIANEVTQGIIHLKTAGTSYLEALRVVAEHTPDLFRKILDLAAVRYETDRVSYHVSAQSKNIPLTESLADEQLPGLLDQFDMREVLHVTFGSVIDAWGRELKECLVTCEDSYYQALETHFDRHLQPFEGHSTPSDTIRTASA